MRSIYFHKFNILWNWDIVPLIISYGSFTIIISSFFCCHDSYLLFPENFYLCNLLTYHTSCESRAYLQNGTLFDKDIHFYWSIDKSNDTYDLVTLFGFMNACNNRWAKLCRWIFLELLVCNILYEDQNEIKMNFLI